jgi:hypothetical protein
MHTRYKLMKGYPGGGTAYNAWDGWMNPQEDVNLTRWEPSPSPHPCENNCLFDVTGGWARKGVGGVRW